MRRSPLASTPAKAALGLLVAALLLGLAEGGLRLQRGSPPPGTWAVATGWAGCFYRDLGDRFQPCSAEGDSPRQVFSLRSDRPRVAVLGGSSVFGGSGPDATYFPDLVGQALPRLAVINLGQPGTNSLGVAMRVAELDRRGVDAFVIYSGHNDVAGRVFGGAAEDVVLRSRIAARLERLWLYRVIEDALGLYSPGMQEGAVELVDSAGRGGSLPVRAPIYSAEELRAVADLFAENLRQAVLAARGRPVILVTPVSNPLVPPVATAPGPVPAPTGSCEGDQRALARPDNAAAAWAGVLAAQRCEDPTWLLEAAAEVTRLDALPVRATPEVVDAVRTVAAQTGATLLDLHQALPLSLRASDLMFIDSLHLSPQGHQAIAQALIPVVEQVMTPQPGSSGP